MPRGSLHEPIRHDCGDDAFFLAKPTEATAMVGIADGVSSWARMGVDPAVFAWELMQRCKAVAEGGSVRGPRGVLADAYWGMVRSGTAPLGSSTACVVSLDRVDGRLNVANLGDSGALLVRGGKEFVLQTQEQQHYFNCPYQLMAALPGQQARGDMPEASAEYSAQAEDGDVLVMATDGFFDNVFKEKALDILARMGEKEPGEIAGVLVTLAHSMSHSRGPTPFSVSALQNGMRHYGGKPDDITVLVARIASHSADSTAAGAANPGGSSPTRHFSWWLRGGER